MGEREGVRGYHCVKVSETLGYTSFEIFLGLGVLNKQHNKFKSSLLQPTLVIADTFGTSFCVRNSEYSLQGESSQ